jgi:hypothetical protein
MHRLLPPPRPALNSEEATAYAEFRINQIATFERLSAVAGAVSILLFILWDAQFSDGALSETLPIRVGIAAILMVLILLGAGTAPGRVHNRIGRIGALGGSAADDRHRSGLDAEVVWSIADDSQHLSHRCRR